MNRLAAAVFGILILFMTTSVASAQHNHRHGYQPRVQHHHHHHHHYHRPRTNWTPYIVGGLALGAVGAGTYYYNTCWIENRPVFDRYGYYVGNRRVRICR